MKTPLKAIRKAQALEQSIDRQETMLYLWRYKKQKRRARLALRFTDKPKKYGGHLGLSYGLMRQQFGEIKDAIL